MRDARTRSGAGAVLLIVLVAFVVSKYVGTINPWKLTQWLFSYELGFVRRGLAGSLLQAALPEGFVTREAVVAVSLASVGAFMLAFCALAFPIFADPKHRRSLWIAVAAFLAPGIGHLLADLGRFDVLNLLLALLAILFARRSGRFPYPLFLALAGVQMLIHEAALLLAIPLLWVAYLHANGRLGALTDRTQWAGLGLRVAPLLLLFGAIAVFGRADLALPDLVAQLDRRSDFTPAPRSTLVLVRSLDSNLAQVVGGQRPPGAGPSSQPALGSADLLSFWLILGVALLQQAFAHVAFRALDRERRLPVWFALHLCFAAPLLTMLVGVDWPRWAALASAQCAVLMVLFARELPAASKTTEPRGFVALALVFLVVASGSSYRMHGARLGMTTTPQMNTLSWLQDSGKSTEWYEPFLRADLR